jgi:pimeloyl-ACP methyl ester carboxylesterase
MTTVVLIHGFPFNATLWRRVAPPGALAPDLPGFGAAAPGPDTVDAYAQSILARVDGPLAVVGHSMGGYVALAMHRLARERITGVAFVASRAVADTPEIRVKRRELEQQVLSEGVDVLERGMMPRLFGPGAAPAMLEEARALIRQATPQGAAAAIRAMMNRPDSVPQLATIAVPALVVAGRHDQIVPAAESESIARAIPASRLVWCERSGHLPMIEEPDLLRGTLAHFLKEI